MTKILLKINFLIIFLFTLSNYFKLIDAINKFEPRVQILDVKLSETEDQNNLDVSITFSILNSERPVILNTTIQRAR